MLVAQGDAVGKQVDVESLVERLPGLPDGVLARRRDERESRALQFRQRRRLCLRRHAVGFGRRVGPARLERVAHRLDGPACLVHVPGSGGEDEVVRTDGRQLPGFDQRRVDELLPVRGRPHHRERVREVVRLSGVTRDPQ
ncbi:hypothetical protein BRC64_04690 [Halobacteriales archaeon QH_10_67_22]|nr:MAG: hypothetical protein BRC64_04690 [Halobacteriales archaeon QH_10_67_22]